MSVTYATNGTGAGKNGNPPGKPLSVGQQILDKGAQMLQPINQMSQHACTFALYSHEMTRQIQTHHLVTRLNQDFLQATVYDSNARLIGDKLPLGPPPLMMSPQAEGEGVVKSDLVKKRDANYNISMDDMMRSRIEIPEPEWINPTADYWRQHNKCFEIAVESTDRDEETDRVSLN
nr:oil body-associated protein 2C-like [Tanacetum cinerariifolium]